MPNDVEATGFKSQLALLTDGSIVPISNWIDKYGDECEPEDAITCVVKETEDRWLVVFLERFVPIKEQ